MLYTPKKAATETRNSTQYKPVDFFVDSILQLILAKIVEIKQLILYCKIF